MLWSHRLLAFVLILSTLMCAVTAQSAALIVALGDSNTAGYGVSAENAFPARLQAMLRRGGYDVQVANAVLAQ
jgi:acyl-CoA thioesterase-1